jgi:hypothetical protein
MRVNRGATVIYLCRSQESVGRASAGRLGVKAHAAVFCHHDDPGGTDTEGRDNGSARHSNRHVSEPGPGC